PTIPKEQASEIDASQLHLDTRNAVLALFPYVLIVVVISITSLWRIGVDLPAALNSTSIKIEWPGLHGNLVNEAGEPITNTIFNFNWLSTPGTILFFCGIITALVYAATSEGGKYPMSLLKAFAALGEGGYKMRYSALTIAAVMGLAYV